MLILVDAAARSRLAARAEAYQNPRDQAPAD